MRCVAGWEGGSHLPHVAAAVGASDEKLPERDTGRSELPLRDNSRVTSWLPLRWANSANVMHGGCMNGGGGQMGAGSTLQPAAHSCSHPPTATRPQPPAHSYSNRKK